MELQGMMDMSLAGRLEPAQAERGGGGGGFALSLMAAVGREDADEQAARRAQVREAAEQFVASAFLVPIFKQMRSSSLRGEMFHGGMAEDVFGAQLDTHLADRMVGSMNMPLVDAIERQFMGGVSLGGRLDAHG